MIYKGKEKGHVLDGVVVRHGYTGIMVVDIYQGEGNSGRI